MKLLMHICCSNCSIYPLQSLLYRNIDVTGLWFNPNIHPFTEYSKRLDSLRKLQRLWAFDVEYIDQYPLDDFLKAVAGKGAERCSVCYEIRLDRTAEIAKKMNLDGFTTSLLVSPHQKFDIIIETGNEMAKRHGIAFYSEDFRKGWQITKSLSAELDLYRQKYCGCVYSEMERYRKKERGNL
ncbi:MAG: epoxyqueuosine reductase QueH [Nitrospirota bacterium]|nr:epoxyqueuosine reductase QueH [Nitrospirota bacterium]